MEYRYQPKAANKNAVWIVSTLGALAVGMLGLGMGNVLALRTLWHSLFLVLAVAAVYLLFRYFLSSYVYIITEEWGEPTLVITQVQGKRMSTHCRLTLSRLICVVPVPDPTSPEGRAALSDYMAERVRYAYLATMGKAPTQIVYGREGGVRFAIRIEGDAAFMAALAEATARAGVYSYDDGEDYDEDEEYAEVELGDIDAEDVFEEPVADAIPEEPVAQKPGEETADDE